MLTREYEQHLRASSLTAAQFELLAELHGRGSASQVELAEALAVDQTTLSRGLRLLVTRNWVARAPHGADRRVTRFGLTPTGRDGLRLAMPQWKAAQEAVQRRLGSEWQTVWAAVERLGAESAGSAEPVSVGSL